MNDDPGHPKWCGPRKRCVQTPGEGVSHRQAPTEVVPRYNDLQPITVALQQFESSRQRLWGSVQVVLTMPGGVAQLSKSEAVHLATVLLNRVALIEAQDGEER